jgi:hypothetical protein
VADSQSRLQENRRQRRQPRTPTLLNDSESEIIDSRPHSRKIEVRCRGISETGPVFNHRANARRAGGVGEPSLPSQQSWAGELSCGGAEGFEDGVAFLLGAGGVNDGNAEAERWFTGSAAGDENRESEHGGVYFALIGGVSAFAGVLKFGLQRGECGRRSFGEAD